MGIETWDLPKIREAMNELQFIVTSDGRIGVGWSNRGEDGGFSVLKWLSNDLADSALQHRFNKTPNHPLARP